MQEVHVLFVAEWCTRVSVSQTGHQSRMQSVEVRISPRMTNCSGWFSAQSAPKQNAKDNHPIVVSTFGNTRLSSNIRQESLNHRHKVDLPGVVRCKAVVGSSQKVAKAKLSTTATSTLAEFCLQSCCVHDKGVKHGIAVDVG
jgi:hypothetical protein